MITIRGQVRYIIFRNEGTGWTVMDFRADEGERFTAVGHLPQIVEGEVLDLKGDFFFHPKRGEQFVFESVEFVAPISKKEIKKFLGSGLFPHVGPATAGKIVDHLGVSTLEKLDANPEILSEIKGIGKKTAKKIAAGYILQKNVRENMFFLQNYGISLSKSFKICEVYGKDVKKKVTTNPYSLINDIEGIGFLTADRIAESIGVERDSPFRIRAGIKYTLERYSQEGHTYLEEEEMVEKTSILLDGIDKDLILDTETQMIFEKELITYSKKENYNQILVALPINYYSEKSIAVRLKSLRDEVDTLNIDIMEKISTYEREHNIVLHEKQKIAVCDAINQGAVVITGGPGTGKTTIIKCILEINDGIGVKSALAAPTGRASKRMEEATGRSASTIHRLLEVDMSSGVSKFIFNEHNPLPYDTIILDEVSMADIYIFNALLKAIKKGGKLILVGDKDQLPSVAAGNILDDIIESGLFPVSYLTEIYRQEAGSLIIVNAHKINKGEFPTLDNNSTDFFFNNMAGQEKILFEILELVSRRLPSFFEIESGDIQVLSPTKKGVAGVVNLNKELQLRLNKNDKQKIVVEDESFKIGDKVMQKVNNYNLKWTKTEGEIVENGEGVFNGEIGFVTDIYRGNIEVTFEDGKIVLYAPGDYSDIMLAYAVSVHKSQGCEFPVVVIAITGSRFLMNRNLLYTAVTRAKKAVILVGPINDLYKMINNVYTVERKTLLKNFILEIIDMPVDSTAAIKDFLKKKK